MLTERQRPGREKCCLLCQHAIQRNAKGCWMPAAAAFAAWRYRLTLRDIIHTRCKWLALARISLSLFLELIAIDGPPRQPAIGCAE